MKYLQVISSLDPTGGGPAEGVRQLCDAAGRLGQRCEVATFDPPSAAWLSAASYPVHALGPPRLGNYRYAPRARAWLRDNARRFDAVIVNGLWQHHGFAVRQALRNTDTPYFVFTHGMLDPWFKRAYPVKHLKKWLYWPWGEYRVLRDACAVLFTCEEERIQARRSFSLYRASEAVVGYGTPGPDGDAAAQRALFLSRFPALDGCRLLLFLGRLHPKKGCDLLLDAFAGVARLDSSLRLVMAGPDSHGLRALLERRARAAGIESRVVWAGMLNGDLKWGAFRAAEAFALTSHQENFGIAVAEALACGVPVLLSNKVNIWREIVADEAGLVADDTREGAARLLQEWCALAAPERDRLARNALSSFRRRFHIDAAARALAAAMQERIRRQIRGVASHASG